MIRPQSESLSPLHAAMPEWLVQAAVQAGLDAVRDPLAAAWLACILSASDESEDVEGEDVEGEDVEGEDVEGEDGQGPLERCGARRLRPVAAVVGFDAPSAEGTGHVPWFAD